MTHDEDWFCGAGGASDGLRDAGAHPVGLEWDATACSTHHAAGHPTIRADLTKPLPVRGPVRFLWASPPCTAFSMAGKGHGNDLLPELVDATVRRDWAAGPKIHDDPNVWLPLSTFGHTDELRPAMLAFEQVPGVLPLWQAFGHILDQWGYSWWAGVLNAADYGVPQTRRRAILMASRVGTVHPPVATHAAEPSDSLFGTTLPWVTMAQALGWDGTEVVNTRGDRQTPGGSEFPVDQPSWALTEKTRSWVLQTHDQPARDGVYLTERQANGATRSIDQPAMTITSSADNGNFQWAFDRPSTTVVGSFRPDIVAAPGYRTEVSRQDAEGSIRITVRDALILQGFDPDRPVLGSKTAQFRQVGNAVPPPIAQAVAGALLAGAA